MSLERKLARWQEAGLIDAAARERIEAFERSQRKPVVLYALSVLGGGTIALGVVSLIAANWDAIPGRVKLGCDLLLGAALAFATYVARERGHATTREALITVYYGFSLASIALVGQVYQLGTPTYQGLLLWSAATAPLVLLGYSRYLAALWLAGLATTHGLSLEALFDHLERWLDLDSSRLGNLLATLLFASPLLYVLVARIPWLVRERPEFSRTFTSLAWAAVLLFGFGLQFVWYSSVEAYETLSYGLLACALLAFGLAAALRALYPSLAVPVRRTLQAILAFAWLSLALGTAFPRGDIEFVGALLQIVWLALFAAAAAQLGRGLIFQALTAAIAVRILVVYFEVFGSMLSTGLGLITGGLLTLLMAVLWRRKARDLATHLQQRSSGGGDVA